MWHEIEKAEQQFLQIPADVRDHYNICQCTFVLTTCYHILSKREIAEFRKKNYEVKVIRGNAK